MATDTIARNDESDSTDTTAEPKLSFDQLPLSEEVRRALSDMGYTEAMPVQLAVWEPAADGKDVVVQARTGTGKTAAFGLPIIDRLVRKSARAVQALILCPTRELALQVSRELDQLAAYKSVSTVPVYGGAPMPRQVNALAQGTPVVVGTPGRVLDHLKRGTLDPSAIRTLVLDESDEMLSMGFEKELTAIMERLPEERQTLLFSATLPADIERIVRNKLREPEFVLLSGDHIGALEVSHYVYLVTHDKLGGLMQVLEIENPHSAVIFCNTRSQTESVALALQNHGFNADWLNGDLPQSEREKVMAATRQGRLRFMVATDVAARGIDISHLTHVINCDFPQDAEGYVHRTGRTGRAGQTGTAISLVTPQDIGSLYILRLTYGIRPIERRLPTAGEHRTRLETDFVSSLAATFAPRGGRADHRALARRLLSHDEAEAVIAGMLSEYLSAHPGVAEAATTSRRDWTPPPAPEPAGARRRKREASSAGRTTDRRTRKGHEEPSPTAASSEPTTTRRTRQRREEPPKADARGTRERPEAPPEAEPLPKRTTARRTRPRQEAPPKAETPPERGATPVDEDSSPWAVPTPRPRGRRTQDSPAKAAPRSAGPSESDGLERLADEEVAAAPTPARRRRSRSTRTSAPVAVPADVSADAGTDATADDGAEADAMTIELYVNVGRKDGAGVRSLKTLLIDDGGLDREQIKRVRVRERCTFIEVDTSVADAAIERLSRGSFADKQVEAAISERSARQTGAGPRD